MKKPREQFLSPRKAQHPKVTPLVLPRAPEEPADPPFPPPAAGGRQQLLGDARGGVTGPEVRLRRGGRRVSPGRGLRALGPWVSGRRSRRGEGGSCPRPPGRSFGSEALPAGSELGPRPPPPAASCGLGGQRGGGVTLPRGVTQARGWACSPAEAEAGERAERGAQRGSRPGGRPPASAPRVRRRAGRTCCAFRSKAPTGPAPGVGSELQLRCLRKLGNCGEHRRLQEGKARPLEPAQLTRPRRSGSAARAGPRRAGWGCPARARGSPGAPRSLDRSLPARASRSFPPYPGPGAVPVARVPLRPRPPARPRRWSVAPGPASVPGQGAHPGFGAHTPLGRYGRRPIDVPPRSLALSNR